jgi:hypothetical protein
MSSSDLLKTSYHLVNKKLANLASVLVNVSAVSTTKVAAAAANKSSSYRILKELSTSASDLLVSKLNNNNNNQPPPNRNNLNHRPSFSPSTGESKNGYIVAFVFIFIIVLLGIVGRVIYSANDSPIANLAYLKYHRTSAAAAALNRDTNETTKHNPSSNFE